MYVWYKLLVVCWQIFFMWYEPNPNISNKIYLIESTIFTNIFYDIHSITNNHVKK